jgi:hypothetical protein
MKVVFVDSLVHAQQLAGAPSLFDPLHQVLYSAHPYANGINAAFNQTPQLGMRSLVILRRRVPSSSLKGAFVSTVTEYATVRGHILEVSR